MLIAPPGRGACGSSTGRPRRKPIDIGCFYSDSSRISAISGWKPAVRLREGLRQRRLTTARICLIISRTAEMRVPFLSTHPRRGCRPRSARRSIACSRAAGSCSVPSSRHSRPNSPRRRGAARRRRRQRHGCDRARAAGPRHRSRRRSDHVAAVGGVQRSGDHDGRRAPVFADIDDGAADAGSGGRRGSDHAADRARSCRCTSTVRPPT